VAAGALKAPRPPLCPTIFGCRLMVGWSDRYQLDRPVLFDSCFGIVVLIRRHRDGYEQTPPDDLRGLTSSDVERESTAVTVPHQAAAKGREWGRAS
jgi:hypothetical protein